MKTTTKELDVRCQVCGDMHTLECTEAGYNEWLRGGLIQQCLPELTAGQRELLISGICEDCFNDMFGE